MNPRIDQIRELTARRFDVTIPELDSPCRAARLVTARHVAMYLARKLTTFSLVEIGKRFGNREHGTVIHACRNIESLKDVEKDVADSLDEITQSLMGVENWRAD